MAFKLVWIIPPSGSICQHKVEKTTNLSDIFDLKFFNPKNSAAKEGIAIIMYDGSIFRLSLLDDGVKFRLSYCRQQRVRILDTLDGLLPFLFELIKQDMSITDDDAETAVV